MIMMKYILLMLALSAVLSSHCQTGRDYLDSGNKKYEQKNYKGAEVDLSKSINLDTGSAKAYYSRALARTYLGDLSGAVEDYSRAISKDPADSGAYCGRGSVRAMMRDYWGSITDYTGAIKVAPGMVRAYVGRGDAEAQVGKKAEALEDYNKAVDLDSISVDARFGRCRLNIILHDYQGALRDITVALERSYDGNNGKLYYFRGLAKYFLRQGQSGCQDFAKASELGYELADESIEQYCR